MTNGNDTGNTGNTGNTGDTGDTGDTGSDDVLICEMKLEEFDRLDAEFMKALAAWRLAYAAFKQAEKDLDEAWSEVSAAQTMLDQAVQKRGAGNPNQADIDNAKARIAEIDAIDPESELDRLMPRLTGDEPGGDDDAWMQARYYLGLIQERAKLEAQIEQWEQFDPVALDAAVATAGTALQDAKDVRKTMHAEFVRREAEAQNPGDVAQNARNLAVNSRNRYIDFGCPRILDEEIEEPEAITH